MSQLTELSMESTGRHAARVLQEAIRFRTVAGSREEFEGLRKCLEKSFPNVFSKCICPDVPKSQAILLLLKGKSEEKPVMLTAHQDVVPASEENWTHGPFEGVCDGTWIWGRGSFDDKVSLIAILASLEHLLEKGFEPSRDIYLGFGDSEEVLGNGALSIRRVLEQRGVSPDFILDEGGAVAKDFIKGMKYPVATIGVQEKGFMSVRLTVKGNGGHSSAPLNPEPLARLGRAMWRAEHTRFPVYWTESVSLMLRGFSRALSGPLAFLFRHNRFFRPLLTVAFSHIQPLRPFIKATCTATMAEGARAANVIPKEAAGVLNIRYMPGQDAGHVLRCIKKSVNDRCIEYEIIENKAPSSRASRTDGAAFALVSDALLSIWPNAVVVPYLMTGASDAGFYEPICPQILRLSPVLMDRKELAGMHGVNERISLQNVDNACAFYTHLLSRL